MRGRRGFLAGLFFLGKVREIGGMQAMDAVSVGEGRFLDFYSIYWPKAIKQQKFKNSTLGESSPKSAKQKWFFPNSGLKGL